MKPVDESAYAEFAFGRVHLCTVCKNQFTSRDESTNTLDMEVFRLGYYHTEALEPVGENSEIIKFSLVHHTEEKT